ncbi:uncharacterized protein CCOS01_08125 [Colletotrichum costaricense]|uniref:Uncharacterized protein n=1 Tax=Colletotrichum costaricense TaxID=1209916 RepID=A0AAI9YV39_9PEZI|nr:uncharacterized protein CCOS01_08125 [Colletotrichum costaricense]KAK1525707.1 hypothetical protein CCOS01_08125 [Colletotrichum costaricense]
MLQSPRKPTYTVVFAATAAAAIVNFVLDQLPRIAPHRIASQVPGLLPAFSLPLPPPITAASSSAINSSTQQATHVEHQRPPAPPKSKVPTHILGPSPPSPGFHFQPSRRPAQPALREPKALGPRVSHPSAPFLHSSKVTANISLSYSLDIRTGHTESTSHANARREPATTAAQGALASLAPSSLSPALSVTVAATTNCPLLRHSTAQHRTARHHFRPSCLLCFASLQQKQGERRCCKT